MKSRNKIFVYLPFVVSLVLSCGGTVIVDCPPAFAQTSTAETPFDLQLRALGDPSELKFLKSLDNLSAAAPDLAAVIDRRLQNTRADDPGAVAATVAEIRSRFAADMIVRGQGLSARVAARSLGFSAPGTAAGEAGWRDGLARAMVSEGLSLSASGFDRLIRPQILEAIAIRNYSNQLIGAGTLMPGGGIGPFSPRRQLPSMALADAPVITGGGTKTAAKDLQCDKTFDALKGTFDAETSRRSEPFDPHEFREVMFLTTRDVDGNGGQSCTGTLISKRWLLTAAHCVMFTTAEGKLRHLSVASITGSNSVDYDRVIQPPNGHRATRLRDAPNNGDHHFNVIRVIVPGAYNPNGLKPFTNDIALFQLDYDADDGPTATPARLGRAQDVAPALTVAGYGYTPENPNTPGILNVGWPPPASASGGMLTVPFTSVVTQDGQSRICPGDSGGPLFAGRHRGCRVQQNLPHLRQEAARPRVLVGVNSTIQNVDPSGVIDGIECGGTAWNRMANVTDPAIRKWVCERTNNEAGGCLP